MFWATASQISLERRGTASSRWRGGTLLRQVLLAASRRDSVRKLAETAPYTRSVVRRFIAGTGVDDALGVTEGLAASGLLVTLDQLGEDTLDPGQADTIVTGYVT